MEDYREKIFLKYIAPQNRMLLLYQWMLIS